jgi:hypothetical protein
MRLRRRANGRNEASPTSGPGCPRQRLENPQHGIASGGREHHDPHPIRRWSWSSTIAVLAVAVAIAMPGEVASRLHRSPEIGLERPPLARFVDRQLVHPDPLRRRQRLGHERLGDDVAMLLAGQEEQARLVLPADGVVPGCRTSTVDSVVVFPDEEREFLAIAGLFAVHGCVREIEIADGSQRGRRGGADGVERDAGRGGGWSESRSVGFSRSRSFPSSGVF